MEKNPSDTNFSPINLFIFFLNLAFAAIVVSAAAYFGLPAIWQIPAFAILSVVSNENVFLQALFDSIFLINS